MILTVAAKETIAEDVVSLTLEGEALPEWTPGAHIDIGLPSGHNRSYSLCGNRADRHVWRVAVLREPNGLGGSAYVHDTLAAGDQVAVTGPRNHFQLIPAPRYLFIAGGIGITPILPMLAAASEAGADWHLRYGGRRKESMAFLDELSRYGDRVTIQAGGLLDLDCVNTGELVYCCGPEPLLAAVEARCPSVHLERFRPIADDGPSGAFEVELARSGLTVTVPEGVSVLHAIEGAGVDVLSSCQEGTCGTCETGVLDGVPDHRDSILTGAERDTCEFMMICVSRSRTPRLVLDL
jgi:ferredoxin-NADP reductase